MFSSLSTSLIRLVLLFLLAVPFWGCHEEFHVQSRSIAGEYEISGTVSYTISGAVSSQPLSGTLNVTPGDTAGVWLLQEKTTSSFDYPITLTGNSFTFQPFSDAMLTSTIRYNGTQSGSGTADGYQITIDRHASADYYVVASSAGNTTIMAKCTKRVQIRATRRDL